MQENNNISDSELKIWPESGAFQRQSSVIHTHDLSNPKENLHQYYLKCNSEGNHEEFIRTLINHKVSNLQKLKGSENNYLLQLRKPLSLSERNQLSNNQIIVLRKITPSMFKLLLEKLEVPATRNHRFAKIFLMVSILATPLLVLFSANFAGFVFIAFSLLIILQYAHFEYKLFPLTTISMEYLLASLLILIVLILRIPIIENPINNSIMQVLYSLTAFFFFKSFLLKYQVKQGHASAKNNRSRTQFWYSSKMKSQQSLDQILIPLLFLLFVSIISAVCLAALCGVVV